MTRVISDRRQRRGDRRRLAFVGLGAERLDDLPAAVLLFHRRRVAGGGRDLDLVDLVGVEAGEDLVLLLGVGAALGQLRGDEVEVRAETGEHDDQQQSWIAGRASLPPPPPGVDAGAEHEAGDDEQRQPDDVRSAASRSA